MIELKLVFSCPLKECPHEKNDCGEKMKVEFNLEQGWVVRQSCGEEPTPEDILTALVEQFKCWSKSNSKEE